MIDQNKRYFLRNDSGNIRDRCSICGSQFLLDEIQIDGFSCKHCNFPSVKNTLDNLITDIDDYAYCE